MRECETSKEIGVSRVLWDSLYKRSMEDDLGTSLFIWVYEINKEIRFSCCLVVLSLYSNWREAQLLNRKIPKNKFLNPRFCKNCFLYFRNYLNKPVLIFKYIVINKGYDFNNSFFHRNCKPFFFFYCIMTLLQWRN